jgi:hypothetical protein
VVAVAVNLQNTLLAYSEWLDGQGLIVSDQGEDADKRTHENLADEFIQQWQGSPLVGADDDVLKEAMNRGIEAFIDAAFEAGWKAHLSRPPAWTLLDAKSEYMAAVNAQA